jgi:hypothetical protein
MRRVQLIQITILVVAIICGYKAVESLISTIIPLLFGFGSENQFFSFVLRFLVLTGIYTAAFFVLIRFNRPIADYIEREGRPDGISEDTPVALRVEQTNLFYVVLISLSLLTLIEVLPTIIMSIFQYFKNEIGRLGTRADSDFKTSALKLVIGVILLFAARPISLWLNKQFNSPKPLIETIEPLEGMGEPEGGNITGLS